MYETFWGLTAAPFANRLSSRWFHEGPVHEEAVARLLFLIERQRGFALLNGDSGSGKTMTLQYLAEQARRAQCLAASVSLTGIDGTEMLWQLAVKLRLAPTESESRWSLWRRIADQLTALRLSRMQTVLIFDHLERADSSCFGLLERLVCLAQEVGQTTFITAVRSHDVPRLGSFLRDLPDLRVELSGFDAEQTDGFIRDMLDRAGATRTIFRQDAVSRIHARSNGLPRTICRLCDLALIAGMAEEHETISGELIDSIATGLLSPVNSRIDEPAYSEFV